MAISTKQKNGGQADNRGATHRCGGASLSSQSQGDDGAKRCDSHDERIVLPPRLGADPLINDTSLDVNPMMVLPFECLNHHPGRARDNGFILGERYWVGKWSGSDRLDCKPGMNNPFRLARGFGYFGAACPA